MPFGDSKTTTQTALRIFHADPAVISPEAAFARAALLGFTHVKLPPPWEHARHDELLATSFSRLDRSLAPFTTLEALTAGARAAGVRLMLDVVLDRACTTAVSGEAVFIAPRKADMLDPRRGIDGGVSTAVLSAPADASALGAWWASMLRGWSDAGIAGYCLLGLAHIPAQHLSTLIAAIRAGAPAAKLLAWTPGLGREALASMRDTGLDGVFSSLPWWDWRSPWLWDELGALRAVAPVLGNANSPYPARGRGAQPQHPATEFAQRRATALAATLGQGWMHVAGPGSAAPGTALSTLAHSLNRLLAESPAAACASAPALLAGESGPFLSLLRCDAADHRSATSADITVVNTDLSASRTISGASLLTGTGGRFAPFAAAGGEADGGLSPDTVLTLTPGGVALFTAQAATRQTAVADPDAMQGRQAASQPRLAIEAPSPCVDGGRFPVKRIAGEAVLVEADILFDGHEKIAAALQFRGPGDAAWQEAAMRPLGNDRWQATLPLGSMGRHEYKVLAWRDRFETFRDELAKKSEAGVDTRLELIEGHAIVDAAATRSGAAALASLRGALKAAKPDGQREMLLSPPLARLMQDADDRPFLVETSAIPVDAERIEAQFASWYEVFPRSMSDDPKRHGTFADVERHLPRIRDMGFDVLYFPPIHPIGRTNRKGRNNTLTPAPDDPGSPYAIGSADGGHDALHPELGSFADFQSLRRAAAAHGLELAIDFAIQCSPDHPWLREHKGWFDWRPDGTIRYAENPPKKYEDIVNVDFYAEDAIPDLWLALCRVVLFWAEQGVRLFRVDNPHTKPFPFWEWMIGEVRQRYPDAVFLAEAFTRPKIMYRLAKIGFSQSYTYFTWRNTKRELQEYLSELDESPPRDFFRPHFFVNTPDINPVFLHNSGRPGFLIRAALAATLSGLWGLYNGFELCEARPVKAGKEEYLDSEKYEIRAWDWDRPGNIVAEVTALNRIRRRNPALQTHLGVTFLVARNDAILYFEKATPDRSNVILVAVSLDPGNVQAADIEVPLWKFGLPDSGAVVVDDLLSDTRFTWSGKNQRIGLSPERPYAIWRIQVEG